MRSDWDKYFIDIAYQVARRGTCLRRCYGAVIVDMNKRIVSTGYCGAPIGEPNCCDVGVCKRQELGIPSGERYELCKSVHAEVNAIMYGDVTRMENGTIYISGFDSKEVCNGPAFVLTQPCSMCRRVIKNAKIKMMVWHDENGKIVREDVKYE